MSVDLDGSSARSTSSDAPALPSASEIVGDGSHIGAVTSVGSVGSVGSSSEPPGPDDHARRARYEPGVEIGRGAMGRVRLVRDARLLRDIAWKEGDAHVLREAWITAQLEHPGIVPVHDLGVTPDGQSFFAMRAIRGHTYAEALERLPRDRGPSGAELPLVRALLQVAQAVAWAHHRGVVHRDLKPANILVGPFGEVQVVDWGLARVLDEAAEPLAEGARHAVARLGARLSNVVGTPRYMAPEQAAGRAVDRRADVWSLGVLLFETLAGQSPIAIAARGAVLAELVALESDHARPSLRALRDVAPATPLELQAIVGRALDPDPSRRYADASAFAADLAAFLDGRRVDAYTYRARDHLRRFVVAFRVPLAVGLAALVALVVLGYVAFDQIGIERDTALAAERQTKDALAASDRNLIEALVGEARTLVRQGLRPESEALAVRALELGEHPEARGILAAFAASPAPHVLGEAITEPCADLVLASSGARALCRDGHAITLFDRHADRFTRTWSRASVATGAAFAAGDSRVVVNGGHSATQIYDSASGARLAALDPGNCNVSTAVRSAGRFVQVAGLYCMNMIDAIEEVSQTLDPCRVLNASALADDGRWAAICDDGRLHVGSFQAPEHVTIHQTTYAMHTNEPSALAFMRDGGFIVGDADGGVTRLAPDGTSRMHIQPVVGLVRMVEPSPDGRWLAVSGEAASITLLDLPGLALHASLPSRDGYRLSWLDPAAANGARFSTIGVSLAPATQGRPVVRTWQATPGLAARIDLPDGVTGVAFDPSASELVVGHGPTASIVNLAQGSRALDLGGDGAVVKSVAFDSRGRAYAGSAAGRFVRYEHESAARLVSSSTLTFPGSASRRYLVAADDWLVAGSFGRGVFVSRGDVAPPYPVLLTDGGRPINWIDLDESPDGRFIAGLRDDGALCMVTVASPGPPTARVVGDDPNAIAVAPFVHGAWIAAAGSDRVIVWETDTPQIHDVLVAEGADLLEVATDVGGRHVAAGARDGSVYLWDIARPSPIGVFRGHRERVVTLAFDPLDRVLVTGSWDGDVRLLALPTFTRDARELARDFTAHWGYAPSARTR